MRSQHTLTAHTNRTRASEIGDVETPNNEAATNRSEMQPHEPAASRLDMQPREPAASSH